MARRSRRKQSSANGRPLYFSSRIKTESGAVYASVKVVDVEPHDGEVYVYPVIPADFTFQLQRVYRVSRTRHEVLMLKALALLEWNRRNVARLWVGLPDRDFYLDYAPVEFEQRLTVAELSGGGWVVCPICEMRLYYISGVEVKISGHLEDDEVRSILEHGKVVRMLKIVTSSLALFEHIVYDHNVVKKYDEETGRRVVGFERVRTVYRKVRVGNITIAFWFPKCSYMCKVCNATRTGIRNFIIHLLREHPDLVEQEKARIREELEELKKRYAMGVEKLLERLGVREGWEVKH